MMLRCRSCALVVLAQLIMARVSAFSFFGTVGGGVDRHQGHQQRQQQEQHSRERRVSIATAKDSVVNAAAAMGAVAVFTAAILGGGGAASAASPSVIKLEQCVDGQGDSCDSLSEGNELIKSLQAKSSTNRAKYEKEVLNTYNEHNFKDVFTFMGKQMVQHPSSGEYEILTQSEYNKLERAGKISNGKFLE